MAFPSLNDGTRNPTFNLFTGRVKPRSQILEEVSRANVDGEAYRKDAIRAVEATEHESEVDVADAAAAKALEDTYMAMRGQLATLTYSDGQTRAVVIINVVPAGVKVCALSVGGQGAGTVVVRARWTLKANE